MLLKIGDRICYRNKEGQMVHTTIKAIEGNWVMAETASLNLLERFIHVDNLLAPF